MNIGESHNKYLLDSILTKKQLFINKIGLKQSNSAQTQDIVTISDVAKRHTTTKYVQTNANRDDSQTLWELISEEAAQLLTKVGVKKALSFAVGKVFSSGIVDTLFFPNELNVGEEELIKQNINNSCTECGACIGGDPSSCPAGVFDGTILNQ